MYQRKRLQFLLSIVLALFSLCCSAQTFHIFEDTGRNLSALDAKQKLDKGEFNPLNSRNFNAGFTHSVFWIALKPPTNSTDLEWVIGNAHINRIDFFSINRQKITTHFITGDYFPFKQRMANYRLFAFPVKAGDSHAIYLARIDKHAESLQIENNLLPARKFYEQIGSENLINGILFGIILLMILFAAFLFFTVRDPLYLYYILYVSASYLWIIANKGYGYEYFWSDSPFFASRARPVFNCLFNTAILYFMPAFIGVTSSKALRKFNVFLKIFSLALVALFLSPANVANALYFSTILLGALLALGALTFIYIIFCMAEKFRKKNKQVLFFLASLITVLIFFAGELFLHLGRTLFTDTFFSNFGVQTGFTVQSMILMFGLAHQLNQYRLDREKLLISVNNQQKVLTTKIIETQESERKKIADQLHDEVGAQLSVIALQVGAVIENNTYTTGSNERLLKATSVLTDVAHTIRNLSHVLMPVAIEKYGFRKALEDLLNTVNSSGKIHIESVIIGFTEPGKTSGPVYISLYRIAQELLNNTLKHAGASHALLQVIQLEDAISLSYEDNGKGLQNTGKPAGKGLDGIYSKIAYYNGICEILTLQNSGILVNIEIPKTSVYQNEWET